MRAKQVLILIMVLSLVLLGCGIDLGGSKPEPTPTPAPATNTPQPPEPTDTPKAEVEVAPTDTPEAVERTKEVPTDTPEPEVAPTDTPESEEEAEPRPTRSAIARPEATEEGAEAKPTVETGQGGVVKKGGTSTEEDVFEFLSHTAWVSDYGDISIVGEVENVSDQTIYTMVAVQAILTDEDGEVVPGDYGAYLDRPVIEPGETSSFWVLIPADQLQADPDTITDYELTLWVSEEPSPDIEIQVDEVDVYEEGGYLNVYGTATNDTDYELSTLSVYSTLYDADGNVVNVTVDMVDLDPFLQPGEQAEFQGYFADHFEDAESFNVFVTGWTPDQTGAQEETETGLRSGDDVFSFDDHTGWIDDYGNVNIVGYVTNTSDETIDTMVLIQAVLTDEDGNDLEGEYTTYLDRPVILPGDWSSYWLWISADDLGGVDPDSITDYELFSWITDEPSPDVELVVDWSSATMEDDAYYVDGSVWNQTDMEFVALAVYSSIYDEDGYILNSTVDIIELDEPLEPGEFADFSGYFVDHFEDAASYAVIVTGYTAEAAG